MNLLDILEQTSERLFLRIRQAQQLHQAFSGATCIAERSWVDGYRDYGLLHWSPLEGGFSLGGLLSSPECAPVGKGRGTAYRKNLVLRNLPGSVFLPVFLSFLSSILSAARTTVSAAAIYKDEWVGLVCSAVARAHVIY